MRKLPYPVRLLPVLLIAASLLLLTKVVHIASALRGLPTATISISEARAEGAPPEPGFAGRPTPELARATTDANSPHADAKAPVARRSIPQRPASETSPAPSLQEIEILQQLAGRRKALDDREEELQRRSDLLQAATTRLDQKLKELKDLGATLERLTKTNDQQQEAKLRSLVKIYENMKPRDAARIFEELDMDTLLPVVERMNERKLAPVMAEMNPGKAKEITRELERQRQAVPSDRPSGSG
jgi:flagellar motility protein MotE (MotC chaperone)